MIKIPNSPLVEQLQEAAGQEHCHEIFDAALASAPDETKAALELLLYSLEMAADSALMGRDLSAEARAFEAGRLSAVRSVQYILAQVADPAVRGSDDAGDQATE